MPFHPFKVRSSLDFASIRAAFPCSLSCIAHHAPTRFTGKSAQIKSKQHSGGNFLEPVFNDFALAGRLYTPPSLY